MEAPTRADRTARLGTTYLDTADIRAAFGPDAPYVTAQLHDFAFMNFSGIVYQADERTALRRLRELRSEPVPDAQAIRTLYRVLELRAAQHAVPVKSAFASEALIYVPSRRPRWVGAGEACWESYGAALGDIVPSLRDAYRDFEGFFLSTLGVPRELPPEGLIAALEGVRGSELKSHEKGQAARRVYAELESALRRSDPAGAGPSWACELRDKGLLWTNWQDFRGETGEVLVNDLPDVARLFAERPPVAFLDVEPANVPKHARLIEACGLRRLSEAVRREMPPASQLDRNSTLTARLLARWQDVARYVYSMDNAQYERLVLDGTFRRVGAMEVLSAPSLEMTVRLNGESARARLDAVATAEAIYLDATAGDDTDLVAHLPELPPDEVERLLSGPATPESAVGEKSAFVSDGPGEPAAADSAAKSGPDNSESSGGGDTLPSDRGSTGDVKRTADGAEAPVPSNQHVVTGGSLAAPPDEDQCTTQSPVAPDAPLALHDQLPAPTTGGGSVVEGPAGAGPHPAGATPPGAVAPDRSEQYSVTGQKPPTQVEEQRSEAPVRDSERAPARTSPGGPVAGAADRQGTEALSSEARLREGLTADYTGSDRAEPTRSDPGTAAPAAKKAAAARTSRDLVPVYVAAGDEGLDEGDGAAEAEERQERDRIRKEIGEAAERLVQSSKSPLVPNSRRAVQQNPSERRRCLVSNNRRSESVSSFRSR